MSSYSDYVIVARISINAMSDKEGFEIIRDALRDRIDGHLLSAQRQARVMSVEPEFMVEMFNASNRAHRVERLAAKFFEDAGVGGTWWGLDSAVREHYRTRAERYV